MTLTLTLTKTPWDAWRKHVSFQDVPFAPAKVQTVSNGKVRVEFETVQQRNKAFQKIREVPSLKAEESKRRSPQIILKGVSKDACFDDAAALLFKQNPSLTVAGSPTDIPVRFNRRNRNDALYNIVLQVTPSIRLKMLEIGRLNFEHQRLRVHDYSPFIQCFKCLQFGHVQARYPSDASQCSHCASDAHNVSDCPDAREADKIKCFNCLEFNAKTHKKIPDAHSGDVSQRLSADKVDDGANLCPHRLWRLVRPYAQTQQASQAEARSRWIHR